MPRLIVLKVAVRVVESMATGFLADSTPSPFMFKT